MRASSHHPGISTHLHTWLVHLLLLFRWSCVYVDVYVIWWVVTCNISLLVFQLLVVPLTQLSVLASPNWNSPSHTSHSCLCLYMYIHINVCKIYYTWLCVVAAIKCLWFVFGCPLTRILLLCELHVHVHVYGQLQIQNTSLSVH